MGKRTVNPLGDLKKVVKSTVGTTAKAKVERIMPISASDEKLVQECLEKHKQYKNAYDEYTKLKNDVVAQAIPYLEAESFKLKKNWGSFFLQTESSDKRIQIIPKDKFSKVDPDNLEDIEELLGEDYDHLIGSRTNISVKEEIVSDKDKLAKFVKIVQSNPDLADMIEINETYEVVAGGLDATYQIAPEKREELLTLVKLETPNVKVVNKK